MEVKNGIMRRVKGRSVNLPFAAYKERPIGRLVKSSFFFFLKFLRRLDFLGNNNRVF